MILPLLGLLALSRSTVTATDADQSRETLARYLSGHRWDANKQGPMLVVDPRTVHLATNDGGLAAFGRKEVRLNSLTAIVPTEMVVIDTSFKDPPNVYDGLPRQAKVLYLMSLLDDSQWKTACTSGIGLKDMGQDQRAVYRSILPSIFTYETEVVGGGDLSDSSRASQPPEVTLTQGEELGVCLRIYKSITLGVRLQSGAISGVAAQDVDMHKRGDEILHRIDNAAEDRNSLFGAQIRTVLENRLKPSDLNFKAPQLDRALSLSSIKTVGDICRTASEASGLTILADVRIAKLPVESVGASARTGDVLEALALCITGAFRKVGDVYELTYDREGIGAKRLKIALWRYGGEYLASQLSLDWKRSIRANGGFRNIAFSPDSPVPVNDAMTRFLDGDRTAGSFNTMPSSDLPAQWQGILQRGSKNFSKRDPVQMDIVEPTEETFWSFVLPDGRPLSMESSLGGLNEFIRPSLLERDYTLNDVVKPIQLRTGSGSAFEFETEDPSVAESIPKMAKAHGFEEIWIQTWQLECLARAITAAKAQGIRIRLVVKPWEVPAGSKPSDSDLTILGMSSNQATVQRDSLSGWGKEQLVTGLAALAPKSLVSLNDPGRASNWQRLVNLSKTSGLDGTVLCDTEPPGYEPTVVRPMFARYETTQIVDLGYSPSPRSRFLVENNVDPVDFLDTRIETGKLDLVLPFFGDPREYGLGSIESSQPPGMMLKWMKDRSDENRTAIQEFAGSLSGSILFQARRVTKDLPRVTGFQLTPWQQGSDLPTSTAPPYLEEGATPTNGYWVWPFGFPIEPHVASRMFIRLIRHLKESPGMLAIDMSSVPADQLAKMLDTWFQSSPVIQH